MADQRAQQIVDIYTDGACSGNPGPGRWGAVLRYGTREKEIYGGEPTETTNNRMELMAPIRALESLTRPVAVRLHTDSKYVLDGVTKWLPRWKTNGWQATGKQPVKNADLWQRLDAAVHRHQVQWYWVKGHAGHPDNERADQLAGKGFHEAPRRGDGRLVAVQAATTVKASIAEGTGMGSPCAMTYCCHSSML